MNRLLLVALVASIGLTACSKKEETTAPASGAPAASQPASSVGSATPNSGKVLQTQQAGGYTYAEVDAGGQKIWLAGAPIDIKPGDNLQWGEYVVMQNFTSKTLNRNFEQILFVNSWGPEGGKTAQMAAHGGAAMPGGGAMPGPSGMGAAMAPAGHAGGMPGAAAPGASQGEVKSVTAAGGYTYVEVNQGGSSIWVAGPETPGIKAGDKVRWDSGTVMQNFTSKTLNRTFDKIVFANQLTVVQ